MGVGFGGQDRCEQRSEVYVKIKKNMLFFFVFFLGGGRVGGSGWGCQDGCERRI